MRRGATTLPSANPFWFCMVLANFRNYWGEVEIFYKGWEECDDVGMKKIYAVIEFNWGKIGGLFSMESEAKKWIEHAEEIEPNLMWQIHEMEVDVGINDDEVISEYRDR